MKIGEKNSGETDAGKCSSTNNRQIEELEISRDPVLHNKISARMCRNPVAKLYVCLLCTSQGA